MTESRWGLGAAGGGLGPEIEAVVVQGRHGKVGGVLAGNEHRRIHLGEVLLIRRLREQIDAGTAAVGLLAGLADPRITPSIVAMHERPGHPWRIDALAGIAGLSPSRFSERFAQLMGTTPMSYLRQWRMVLARQDIERGDRIQLVASRYGYASTEAPGRAFKPLHGHKPTAFRGGPVTDTLPPRCPEVDPRYPERPAPPRPPRPRRP